MSPKVMRKNIVRILNKNENFDIAWMPGSDILFRLICLMLEEGPGRKFQTVGSLYIGQIVEVKNKGRHWSLVQFKDDDTEVQVQGWVFSRYLKPIK